MIPFSADYALNEPTPYSKYFASAPVGRNSVYYRDMSLTLFSRIKLFLRAAYSLEVKRKIRELIRDVKPDVAYVLHIANVLSPSLIDGCQDLRIPVVMRLSDFNLICPAYRCLRDQEICTECESGYYRALAHRCLKRSLPVTAARVLSMYLHDLLKTYRRVYRFVTPSAFLRAKMIERGFLPSKVVHIPSFVEASEFGPSYSHQKYILYFGRIEQDKGVEYLIDAFARVFQARQGWRLRIVGGSSDGEKERLEGYVKKQGLQGIEFLGFRPAHELQPIIQGASFIVVPSIWYDNTPLTIYESFACGKPVIGSNLGGIAEQITHGVDGLLFEAKNVNDLADKMLSLIDDEDRMLMMGKEGRAKLEKGYNSGLHYDRLLRVLEDAVRPGSVAA